MVTYPEDWGIISLGQCVVKKLSYGINAPAAPYMSCLPKYIRITDITDEGKYSNNDCKSIKSPKAFEYILHSGDIVLARTGASVGKSYLYNDEDGVLVYAGFLIKVAVDSEHYNPRYIFAQLRTKRFWTWVAMTSMRSGQPGINGKEYASFTIPMPSKKEQDVIVEVLSAFDTYIDDLAELIDKKKAIRDGALEDLMSGRTRLDGFEGNWENKKLDQIASFRKGRTCSEKKYYVSTENIKQNYAGIIQYGNSENYLDGCQFFKTDTLLSNIRPYLKKAWYAEFDGCCSADVLVFKGKEGIDTKYLYYILANNTFVDYVMSGGIKGIKMPRGDKKYMLQYEIAVPTDKKEQEAIAVVLTSMDEEIESLEAERDKMVQIREGAMDDLLTGRVRLSV